MVVRNRRSFYSFWWVIWSLFPGRKRAGVRRRRRRKRRRRLAMLSNGAAVVVLHVGRAEEPKRTAAKASAGTVWCGGRIMAGWLFCTRMI